MAKTFLNHIFLPFTVIIVLATLVPYTQGLSQALDKPSSLVPSPSTILNYHGGPLLTRPINIYLIWYGSFYRNDRAPINDFFASFTQKQTNTQSATVQSWWGTISSYKDRVGNRISSGVKVAKQINDIGYSLGKNIKRAQIREYLQSKISGKVLPLDPHGIYLVLTSKDVVVENFCISSCGYHENLVFLRKSRIVFAHVGDSSAQCPGKCAWPYAIPAYGPPGNALKAPNGVGSDGIIVNIATVLAGAVTNPFKSGYFQGDVLAPLEAVTACPGVFGAGAYPGFPGDLMEDKVSKASYNAYGVNGRKYLLPAIWDPKLKACKA